jgi:hypothetical protein
VGLCAGKTLKGGPCKRKVGSGSRFCCKHAAQASGAAGIGLGGFVIGNGPRPTSRVKRAAMTWEALEWCSVRGGGTPLLPCTAPF